MPEEIVLIGTERVGKAADLTPRARIVATATTGADATIMLTVPTPAAQKDLNIPDEKLNVNGGTIAMGHPLGATGAMILGTMVDEMERRNARRALMTLCVGV